MTRQELQHLNELFDQHDANFDAFFFMYSDEAYLKRGATKLWNRLRRRVERELPALDRREFLHFLSVRAEIRKADYDFEIEQSLLNKRHE
jgi:hypothetical protein